jgi:hypothetical protein
MPQPTPLLPFTGNDEADRLLADDPNALLIGFVLDQQVPLQKAFSAHAVRNGSAPLTQPSRQDQPPEEPSRRGRRCIASRPTWHGARRSCAPPWCVTTAAMPAACGARHARARPGRCWAAGITDEAKTLIAISAAPGIEPPGWDEVAYSPDAGDVTPRTLAEYQAGKRAKKALRARQVLKVPQLNRRNH